MITKCKHCKESNFGVILTEIKTGPVKMINGVIHEALEEPKVERKIDINYCFTCKKEITEEDLMINEICPICNAEVDSLINGVCKECDKIKKNFSKMTKDDLILMLMKNNNNLNNENTLPQIEKDEKEDSSNDKSDEIESFNFIEKEIEDANIESYTDESENIDKSESDNDIEFDSIDDIDNISDIDDIDDIDNINFDELDAQLDNVDLGSLNENDKDISL